MFERKRSAPPPCIHCARAVSPLPTRRLRIGGGSSRHAYSEVCADCGGRAVGARRLSRRRPPRILGAYRAMPFWPPFNPTFNIMATIQALDPGTVFAHPHEIVTFIDSLQREFPDAPRSRIAEALFEGRDHPAVSGSRETLRDFVRTRLVARKYSTSKRPASTCLSPSFQS